MENIIKNEWNINSAMIVERYEAESIGISNTTINDAATVDCPRSNAILFINSNGWNDTFAEALKSIRNSFIIVEPQIKEKILFLQEKNQIVIVNNSRLYFAKALNLIVESRKQKRNYLNFGDGSIIGENVLIGKNVIIEPFVFIDHNVTIGENVLLKSGAKIRENTQIGRNTVIGENSVIGAQGFGIEEDTDGNNIRIPHIGGVIIGENVEIGSLTSVVAGTIKPTIIEETCFIDDLVHIAHNCHICKGTLITACSELGGSSSIGRYGYISPNTTIRNGISLGERCFIGQASSVQKSFKNNCSIVGNPAREFDRKHK